MRVFVLLVVFGAGANAQEGAELCYRIPHSFCCTSRIKQQCPELCAGVNCGTPDFLQALFSSDQSAVTVPSRDPWPGAPVGTPDLTAGLTSFVERLKSMIPVIPGLPQPAMVPEIPVTAAPAVPAAPARAPEPAVSFTQQPEFPTLVPFVEEGMVQRSTTTPRPEEPFTSSASSSSEPRRRTTPDPRIIRPPESLVIIGDYDEEESAKEVVERPDSELPTILVNSGDAHRVSRKTTNRLKCRIVPPGRLKCAELDRNEFRHRQPFAVSRRKKKRTFDTTRVQVPLRKRRRRRRRKLDKMRSDWKVSLVPRGDTEKTHHVARSIPPFAVDGKSGAPTKPTELINKLSIKPSKVPSTVLEREVEEQPQFVFGHRTTVGPKMINKVSLIPFRQIHFTKPHPELVVTSPRPPPPPPSAPQQTCGVAPQFTPCVSSQDASRALLDCCRRKNLPVGCQNLCRYDITQAEIKAAMDRGQCGILHVAPFLECASQGKDNTECCRYKGLAQQTGPQCEQFCRGTGIGGLGIQHLVCGNAVQTMLQCHHSGVRI